MDAKVGIEGPAEVLVTGGCVFGGVTSAVVTLPVALAFGVATGLGAATGLYGVIGSVPPAEVEARCYEMSTPSWFDSTHSPSEKPSTIHWRRPPESGVGAWLHRPAPQGPADPPAACTAGGTQSRYEVAGPSKVQDQVSHP